MQEKTNHKILEFEGAKVYESPFYHFHIGKVFTSKVADEILGWLETTNNFVSVSDDFYRQSMFPITYENVPENLSLYFSESTRKNVIEHAIELFQTNFYQNVIITAHRLYPGQGTLIHNDYIVDPYKHKYSFTHRMIVYLNHGWTESDGGVLDLYTTSNPNDRIDTKYPIHNTAVGLAFSPTSYHSVSEVHKGVRYTLNFSFLSENLQYPK